MAYNDIWFEFRLPNSSAWVASGTEEGARRVLKKYSHKDAPVMSWPHVGFFYGTRDQLRVHIAKLAEICKR